MKMMHTTILVVLVLGMTGCATSAVDVSDQEFLSMSVAEREAHIADLRSEPETLEERRMALLRAYKPVTFGTKETGYTVQCHWMPGAYNQIAIYNGHNAPGLSRATHQAMMVQMADNECNVLYRDVRDQTGQVVTVSPVTILNDAVAQEDMLRVMARTLGPAVFNGTGAVALRDALGPECGGGGCAPTFNVVSQAMAGSESNAQSGADIKIDTNPCLSGNCQGPPDD